MASEAVSVFLLLVGLGIKWHREQLGIKQEDMINDTGLHLSHYENGRRNITVINLNAIADYLGIKNTALYLFTGNTAKLSKAKRAFLQEHLPTTMLPMLAAEPKPTYKKKPHTNP